MASHHSAYRQRTDALKVTISICLCYTLAFFLVAVWLRVKSRSYKWDDAVAVTATVLSVAQFAIQWTTIRFGQGRSVEYLTASSDVASLNSTNRTAVILFFITLYASKGAAIALTYRFAPLRRHKLTVSAAFGITMILGIASILLLNIDCGAADGLFWRISRASNQCPSQYLRWQVTSALDIFSEILVLAVPIDMIWSLQMRTKTKLGVLSRFWLRAPIIALAVGRFYYIRSLLSATDVSIASNLVIIMQEVEMASSLSASAIISLRPFAKDFNTGFGQGGERLKQYGITKATSSGAVPSSDGLASRVSKRLGLNLSSRGASHGGSMGMSAERSKHRSLAPVIEMSEMGRNERGRKEKTESVKGLTDDVIVQTMDFKVEYEESGSQSSEGGRSPHVEKNRTSVSWPLTDDPRPQVKEGV